jgi:hypothetical protein
MLDPQNNSIINSLEEKTDHQAPVDVDSRFELKYRLNFFQYLKFRNAIQPYMVMDSYTKTQMLQRYLVRSLYFDTFNYHQFDQKMGGDSARVKFRFRTYPLGDEYKRSVRVELKMRQGDYSIKKSVFVNIEEYDHFMDTRHWKAFEDPITNAFERKMLKQCLQPKVLVEYEREGYQTRLKSNLRITFDHQVRACHAHSLFPKKCFYRYIYPKNVILEIKFNDSLQNWLENLIKAHGLKVIANSKYTQSILVSRNDLYHPQNVVLVR